jgi:hypothetical protein
VKTEGPEAANEDDEDDGDDERDEDEDGGRTAVKRMKRDTEKDDGVNPVSAFADEKASTAEKKAGFLLAMKRPPRGRHELRRWCAKNAGFK